MKSGRETKAALQYGALPFRLREGPEVLLVTSRRTGRWVIPKGWPMKGRRPFDAAAIEARQEAGVAGQVGRSALGEFEYLKVATAGRSLRCKVRVFPLHVAEERARWREMGQRRRQWFAWREAATLVQEPALAKIIRRFGKRARR